MSVGLLRREAATSGHPAPQDGARPAGGGAAPAPISRVGAWLAVAALAVAGLATPFGVELAGAAVFGQAVDGPLEVREGEGWVAVAEGADVPADVEVRAAGAPATIAVADARLRLSDGAHLATGDTAPDLRRGSLLVEAADAVEVRLGATRSRGTGTWRIDAGGAGRIATYHGRVQADDGARETTLERYRQVPVRDGALEQGRRPLRYLGGDAWDRRLLAEALAVDRLVDRLADSLARAHGQRPRSPAFYEAFAGVDGVVDEGLDRLATETDEGRFGPPADVLVAVGAVDALVERAGLDVEVALERVVALRRAGAAWGLVLVEHDLGSADLRDAADRALERVERAPPPPEPGEPGEDATGRGDDASDATDGAAAGDDPTSAEQGGTDAGGGSGQGTSPGRPGAQPAPPPPTDEPGDGGGEGGHADGGPLEPAEDAVRDTTGTVGDLIGDGRDDVADAVGGVAGTLGGAAGDGADGGLLGR